MNVLVWNEFKHEKESDDVKVHYPDGIHKYIAGFLQCDDFNVTTATLDDPECGLTQEVLDNTDVIIWWGHMAHKEVPDEIAQRVKEAVLSGMGAIRTPLAPSARAISSCRFVILESFTPWSSVNS